MDNKYLLLQVDLLILTSPTRKNTLNIVITLNKDTSTCPSVPSKSGCMTSKDKTTADKTDTTMQYISYKGKYVMYIIV